MAVLGACGPDASAGLARAAEEVARWVSAQVELADLSHQRTRAMFGERLEVSLPWRPRCRRWRSPTWPSSANAVGHGLEAASMVTDPGVDSRRFTLNNPSVVSIPLACVLGWPGAATSKERSGEITFAEMEVRSLTGARAGQAVSH